MRNILDGFGMFLRGIAVLLSLTAVGVVLLNAGLFEKMKDLRR